MKATRFHFAWTADPDTLPARFQTGVSLHSHTRHSRESLAFIYHAARESMLLRTAIERAEEMYRRFHGSAPDFRRGWWTPPLGPIEALQVEAGQIHTLGHPIALVSLTDHDDIEAPMFLQGMDGTPAVPVSVEWTVPWEPALFHLGIHNLPPRRARAIMAALAEFTAAPARRQLPAILKELAALPETLIVFNHPFWDEGGCGEERHSEAALDFLRQASQYLHAIELNGLRPWVENRKAVALAREWNLPVISGGDRHALEPNAVLNLSSAKSFTEFVSEIRSGVSDVFVASQYRHSHATRIVHNVADVMRTYERHGLGWKHWTDRVFYSMDDGSVRSVRELFGSSTTAPARVFDFAIRLMCADPLRAMVRMATQSVRQPVL